MPSSNPGPDVPTAAQAVRPACAAPAQIGMSVLDVDTPALLVDLDALERNLEQVHSRIRAAGLAVRPHGKAHKCPEIAKLQMAAGAVGICCQKASEAEVFAAAGITNILITNQLVGAPKVERAARLARAVTLSVCVDHPAQVVALAAAVRRHGAHVDVLVEVDIGHGRCGVDSAAAVVMLADAIKEHAPFLTFGGLHAFRGSAQHMRSPHDRAAAVTFAVDRLRVIADALAERGFACGTITGGGTGTYALEADSGFYTEVQPGSYVLMDTDYAANREAAGVAPLLHALQALCTVISVHPGHAVLDGGLKTFAVDQGLPRLVRAGWAVKSVSDEHAVIVPEAAAAPVGLGDKVRLIPSHCDPTVNLHDWLVAFRGERVEQIWAVAARGALF